MPAGPAQAVGAFPLGPLGFAGLGRFPQHEIERIALLAVHRHAFASLQLIGRLARELAVAVELAHGVIHVAAGGGVGQALVLELAHDAEHLRHVVGGTGIVRGTLDAQRIEITVHLADHAVGEFTDRFAVFQCAADDLVLDIRDVAHESHTQPRSAEPAPHYIEGHGGARMADVAKIVDRDAAHVHPHVAGFDRRKTLQPTRKRVVDLQGHRKWV